MIKEVSLYQNINILRKGDHNKIMAIDNKDEWELEKGIYRKVIGRIKKKGKRMFNLL